MINTEIQKHFEYCTQKYKEDPTLWNMARAVIRAAKDQGDFVTLQEALDIAKALLKE